LPEALIDRFLMKIIISYPSPAAEKEVLKRYQGGFSSTNLEQANIEIVSTAEDIEGFKKEVERVRVDESLMEYIIAIISETRNNPLIDIGSSPRGAIALFKSAKGCAAFYGRDFVIPEDIKRMAIPTLRHRIMLKPELELEGLKVEQVITDILSKIKVPR